MGHRSIGAQRYSNADGPTDSSAGPFDKKPESFPRLDETGTRLVIDSLFEEGCVPQ